MAIVMQAFILLDTNSAEEANQALFTHLNEAAFDTSNPVLDFVIGFVQEMPLGAEQHYVDGSFVKAIPGGQLLATANRVDLPC